MKVACKAMTVIALCAGFSPIAEAATIKVKMVKLDPESRKKTWSYEIITTKKSLLPSRSKKFKEEATVSIDPKDFEAVLRVYKTEKEYKELSLAQSVIDTLRDKDNAISIDKDGNLRIMPLKEIEILVKQGGPVDTREISVEKIGSNRDKWVIASWGQKRGEGDFAIDSVTIEQGKTRANRRLAIPKSGWVSFIIANKTNPNIEYHVYNIEQGKAPSFKVLRLDDEGKQPK